MADKTELPTPPIVTGNLKNEDLLAHRRQELVECATRVFVERRFDKASVNDIADACGWSIGSLYRYISTKEDILVLVCDAIFQSLAIDDAASDPDQSAVDALRHALGTFADNVEANHAQVLLMYREYTQLPEDAQLYFQEREASVYRAVSTIVERGVDQGVFSCDDPYLFAIDCVTTIHALALKRWAMEGRSFSHTRERMLNWALSALGARAAELPVA